jgi:hypothetical protein
LLKEDRVREIIVIKADEVPIEKLEKIEITGQWEKRIKDPPISGSISGGGATMVPIAIALQNLSKMIKQEPPPRRTAQRHVIL